MIDPEVFEDTIEDIEHECIGWLVVRCIAVGGVVAAFMYGLYRVS